MGPASLITSTAVSLMAAALFTRRSRSGFLGELDAVRYQALLGPDGEVAEAMGAPDPTPRAADTSPLAELEAPMPPATVIPPLTFAPGQDLTAPPAAAAPAAAPSAPTDELPAPTHVLPAPVDLAVPVVPGAPHPTRPQEIWHPPVGPAPVDGAAADGLAVDTRAVDGRAVDGPATEGEPVAEPAPGSTPPRSRFARLLGMGGSEPEAGDHDGPTGAAGDAVGASEVATPADQVEELLALFDRPPVELPDGSPVQPWTPVLGSSVGALTAEPVGRHADEGEPPWAELDRLAADAPVPEPEPVDAEPPWAERDRTAPAVPLAYLEVDDAVPPPWLAIPEGPVAVPASEGPIEGAGPELLPLAGDGTVSTRGGHLRLAPHLGHDPRRTADAVVLDVATGWCWTALGADAEPVRLVLPTGTVDVPAGTTALTVLEPDGSSFVVVVAGEAALAHPGGRLRLRGGAMALVPVGREPQVDVASVTELASDPLVAHNLALDAAR